MEITKEEIQEIIHVAVHQATKCACGLSPQAQREIPHLLGVVKDIGDDSYSKGVEAIRQNNHFVIKWRRACEKTGNIVLGAIVLACCGIGAAIVGGGFWAWLKKGLGLGGP